MTILLSRARLARSIIYGAPLVAALLAVSVESLSHGILPRRSEFVVTLVLVHAVLGAIGSAAGVLLLAGRTDLRVAGAVAYGVLSLFLYGWAYAVLGDLVR